MARFHPRLKHRQLTLIPLVLTLFCLVSGGPHGLEHSVQLAGPGLALLLILTLPILWAAPVVLMTAELTAAIPEEGGYYAWSKRALGKFWGFQCGWWTWLYSMADAAIYPVLFTGYLSTLFELWTGSTPFEDGARGVALKVAVNFAVIIFFSWLNIRGTKLVGRAAVFLGLLLIVPFMVMAVVGFVRGMPNPLPTITDFLPAETGFWAAFSGGLYLVMWNYLGWDTLSTVTEEVDQPEKTFPRALLWCIPLVTLVYVLPVVVGLRFMPDYTKWEEESWPLIAQAVGGDWLGSWVSIAALASPIALFVTAVLGASRIPFVLAEDRFFPRTMLAVHNRYGTPYRAIVFCALVYAILTTYFSFADLVELNVTLYSASLVPELLALLVLRIKEPNLPRPYKIPGGMPVIWLIVLLPILVTAVAFGASVLDPEEGWLDQLPVVGLLLTGPIAYWLIKTFRREQDAPTD